MNDKQQEVILSAVFGLALIAFIVLKTGHLAHPFFWDEIGVYGKMAFQMADDGPSLHPRSIDSWTSRGHPLLYPFITGLACYWFGTSVTVAHGANLLLAVLLILSMFFHVRKLWGTLAGGTTTTLLMVQPIFFAQAAMTLPEIALALFLWWSTWTYYRGNFLMYCIAGSAAVLTKEPAIIWLFSIFAYDLVFTKQPRWHALKWLSPMLIFIAFLIVQKLTWGWYLFPYHSGSISLVPAEFWHKLKLYLSFIFIEQGRGLILMVLLIFLVSYKPQTLFGKILNATAHRRFLTTGLFACVAYILFSSMSFHLWRYIIPVLPFLCLMAGIAFSRFVKLRLAVPAVLLFMGCILLALAHMTSHRFSYDKDMSYVRAIDIERSALRYIIEKGYYQPGKTGLNFPLAFAVMDHRYGYLPSDVPVTLIHHITDSTKYGITLVPGTSLDNAHRYFLEPVYERYYHDIKMTVYKVTGRREDN